MAEKLDLAHVKAELEKLTGWELHPERAAIAKRFEFGNFSKAFAWMTQIALFAEKIDHHPEWENVYQRVDVILATHSASGITELDIKMAKKMNHYAKLYQS